MQIQISNSIFVCEIVPTIFSKIVTDLLGVVTTELDI